MSQLVLIDRKGTQAFLGGDSEMILIAFRGTGHETLQDWMTDTKIKRKAGPYGEVHRGFLRPFQSAWPEIQVIIEKWHTQAQTLWVNGHTLGGALATLAVATVGGKAKTVHGF